MEKKDFAEADKMSFGRIVTLSDRSTKVTYAPFPKCVMRWMPECRSATNNAPPPVKIVISQEILVNVNKHVSQSLKTEMGGFLLGNRYRDPKTKQDWLSIDQYTEVPPTQATPVEFTFANDAWAQMQKDRSRKFNGKALVGWYHSHPGLGVFLSEADLIIHRERFDKPWMVALVIDPKERHGGFFCWRDGNIDRNSPAEFYEELPHSKTAKREVETEESGSPWENYICYNDATGKFYNPPRLQSAAAPAAKPQPDRPTTTHLKRAVGPFRTLMPESLRPFALLAFLLIVTLASAGILARKQSKVIEPQPEVEAQPSTASLQEINQTKPASDIIISKLQRPRIEFVLRKKGRRMRETDKYVVTWNPINNLLENGARADQLLMNYAVKMASQPATLQCVVDEDNSLVTVKVTGKWPELTKKRKRPGISSLYTDVIFTNPDGVSTPIEVGSTNAVEERTVTRYIPVISVQKSDESDLHQSSPLESQQQKQRQKQGADPTPKKDDWDRPQSSQEPKKPLEQNEPDFESRLKKNNYRIDAVSYSTNASRGVYKKKRGKNGFLNVGFFLQRSGSYLGKWFRF